MQANYHVVKETYQRNNIEEGQVYYEQEFKHKMHQAEGYEEHKRNLINILLSNVENLQKDDSDVVWLGNQKTLVNSNSKRNKRQTDSSNSEIEGSGEMGSDTLPMEEPAGVGLGFILGRVLVYHSTILENVLLI